MFKPLKRRPTALVMFIHGEDRLHLLHTEKKKSLVLSCSATIDLRHGNWMFADSIASVWPMFGRAPGAVKKAK